VVWRLYFLLLGPGTGAAAAAAARRWRRRWNIVRAGRFVPALFLAVINAVGRTTVAGSGHRDHWSPTLAQGDLPKDSGILRTAARHNQVNVGVYACVLRGGEIHRGDAVSVW
jgi:hypothetical protein